MTNNTKYNGGPKSKETKAISSRNSITHGLTARRWLNTEEQALFDETVEAFNSDFDPQTSIEKVLISKIAECSVRLIRIQQVENAMFDLASSEAEHPAEVIRSLDNDSSHPILIEAMQVALHGNPTYNPKIIVEKTNLMDEIDFQNLSDVSGWGYVEKHMPMTKDYIIDKCLKEGLDLYSFIFRETDNSANLNKDVEFINKDGPSNNKPQSKVGATQDSNKIQSTSLQQYLEQLSRNLGSDIQAQMTLNNVEKRSHQIKEAAIPDIQKLGLIQRYRTADERLFSKSLGELIALQDRRKASN
jgi:hypothetical protein